VFSPREFADLECERAKRIGNTPESGRRSPRSIPEDQVQLAGRRMSFMSKKNKISYNWTTGILTASMALGLAGCGGDAAKPTGTPIDMEIPVSTSSGTAAAKSKASSKGLSPGGELGVRERRALKQQERNKSQP